MIEGFGFSIEVNMGDEEECRGFAFHVRGGDAAAFMVSDILEKLGFHAFDPFSETGLFEIGANVATAMRKWLHYRDKILEEKMGT